MMLRWAWCCDLGHCLIQQPLSPMTAVTDFSRNAAQPAFKSNTQRIWEENRSIKMRSLSKQPSCRKNRLLWQGNDFVRFRNEFPHCCNLRWRSDYDLSVRPPIFDGADCRH